MGRLRSEGADGRRRVEPTTDKDAETYADAETDADGAPTGLRALGQAGVIGVNTADVGATRERARQSRLRWLAVVLTPVALWLGIRALVLHRGLVRPAPRPAGPGAVPPGDHPDLHPRLRDHPAHARGGPLTAHPVPAERDRHPVRPTCAGADIVVEEVVKTLNLFLAHRTFAERMGGSARRAILFEGPPGTGKTYMAKAMAAEAGVPFLFVSSSAFQSMFYGQTNRKIRSYFKALRKYARREGGAIGFIEEIDAIGGARGGMGAGRHHDGIAGVVNELLIQLQSFDHPPAKTRLAGVLIDVVNAWLPAGRQLAQAAHAPGQHPRDRGHQPGRRPRPRPACARGASTARSTSTCRRARGGARSSPTTCRRRRTSPSSTTRRSVDTLAALTFGYSPVMLEHLLDEALVWALRRDADQLSWSDIQQAKMTEEIGLAQPVEYAEAERRTIATHESGHATVAWLVGKGRKLEVLSIVKRKDALGLLSHSAEEERFTTTRSEIEALIQIAFGGMVAEELFFGEIELGVAADLQAATTAACQMVGALGMGRSLVSAAALDMPGNIVSKVLANDEGRAEVEGLLSGAKADVRTMLEDHRHVIEALRDALLERDELVDGEILEVITGAAATSETLHT